MIKSIADNLLNQSSSYSPIRSKYRFDITYTVELQWLEH